MDKVEFTTDEKEELLGTIQNSKSYRRKKIKELTVTIIVALAIGLVYEYWTGKLSWTIIFIMLGLGLLGMLVFLFAWYLAGRPINKMESDLAQGIIRTGISEITSINILNRTIRLADGTIVYEDELLHGKWKHGDKILYRITISGEHIFECKRVE